jgi:PIN domain nuclease of toxin-antitoxin system
MRSQQLTIRLHHTNHKTVTSSHSINQNRQNTPIAVSIVASREIQIQYLKSRRTNTTPSTALIAESKQTEAFQTKDPESANTAIGKSQVQRKFAIDVLFASTST